MTKSDHIRELGAAGMTPSQINLAHGYSPQLISRVLNKRRSAFDQNQDDKKAAINLGTANGVAAVDRRRDYADFDLSIVSYMENLADSLLVMGCNRAASGDVWTVAFNAFDKAVVKEARAQNFKLTAEMRASLKSQHFFPTR